MLLFKTYRKSYYCDGRDFYSVNHDEMDLIDDLTKSEVILAYMLDRKCEEFLQLNLSYINLHDRMGNLPDELTKDDFDSGIVADFLYRQEQELE